VLFPEEFDGGDAGGRGLLEPMAEIEPGGLGIPANLAINHPPPTIHQSGHPPPTTNHPPIWPSTTNHQPPTNLAISHQPPTMKSTLRERN
jgi:hypothetical protein